MPVHRFGTRQREMQVANLLDEFLTVYEADDSKKTKNESTVPWYWPFVESPACFASLLPLLPHIPSSLLILYVFLRCEFVGES